MLSGEEEQRIIVTFNVREAVDDLSVVVGYDDIAAKNYSLSAGQYFGVKSEYVDITSEEFSNELKKKETVLEELFGKSRDLDAGIQKNLKRLRYA